MHPAPLSRLLWSLAAVAILSSPAHATKAGIDPDDPYRKLRIPWEDAHRAPEALRGTELMGLEPNAWMDVLARDAEIDDLRKAGIPFEVLVPDLEAQAVSRSRGGGNFGIFHTYSEMVTELDALHATYPSITTDKISIGTTGEGRTIWAMKISDNPNTEEPGEPEVLFDAMHHAREIMTVEVVLDYMGWLCSNYGLDPEATELVDNRQIWFVPIVNPDGFVYNETTNPGGGGLWRKNRRNNGGGCFGVDLNRNYPFGYGLNSGSSPDPCNDTYRGSSAASEPEVAAMIALIEAHEFVTHNSYHSVVGAVLIPWGYQNPLTPDDALFRQLGNEMASESGYVVGTGPEILYLASGVAFDYGYGEQIAKPKIFGFTTEIGGSAFWPAESERSGLIAENHYSNVFLTRAAGVYLGLDSYTVVGGDANGRLDPGETADLVSTIRNFGVLENAAGVTVTLATEDSYLSLTDAEGNVGAVVAGGTGDHAADPFTLTASAATPEGHIAQLRVTMEEESGFSTTENLSLVIGQAPIVYSTDFEADDGGWTQDPSHTASTGAFVRIDPNPTAYQPGDDTTPAPGIYAWVTGQNSALGTDDVDAGVSATRSPVWDLSALDSARLTLQWFHGQRDPADDAGDFFRIELSNDGGATYPGTIEAIGDVANAAIWQASSVLLEDYLPLTNQMRVRVQAADGAATGDIVEAGIDDVFLLDSGTGNEAPSAPVLFAPADQATGQPTTPTLQVTNAVDPEADPITYTFRVYSDALLTQEVASVAGVVEGVGTTEWVVSPGLAVGTYYWRAHAADSEEQGPYFSAASFSVGGATSAFTNLAAVDRPLLSVPEPNPFRAEANVRFTLPSRSRVRIDVFDVSGRHVVRLFEGVAEAGPNAHLWNGRDAAGQAVANGVYFVQMEVDGSRQTRKSIRLR